MPNISDQWFTQEVVVPEPLRLGVLSELGSAVGSETSSASSLDLEVSRLAQALRHIHTPVNITAVDYCRTKARFYSDLDGGNLGSFLACGRPNWSAVRWIVVDGVSGDVLQTLAEHYDLHPLAVEDVLNFQRIKSVSYPGHTYVAAHIWQLQKVKPKAQQQQQRKKAAAAAAAAAAGVHPNAAQQQQQQQQDDDVKIDLEAPITAASTQQQQQQHADLTESLPNGDRLAEMIIGDGSSSSSSSSSSDSSSVVSSFFEGADESEDGDLAYETVEDDDMVLGARKKLGGGCLFADNPTATWGQGWHGTGLSTHENNSHDNVKPSDNTPSQQKLNKKLLQQLNKQQQQQQQQGGGEAGRQVKHAAAAADREEWLQDSAAAAAAVAAATVGGNGDIAKSQGGHGAGSSSSAAAAAAAVPAAAAVVGPDVDLVLPLHASAFGYRPTMSAFRRKRVMMQQVSLFLHHTGVLISIFPGAAAGGGKAADKVAGPVLRSIRGMSSLLLESEDPGYLMQTLLRSCISYSLPVFSRIASVVTKLDGRVLEGRARMELTKRLHVLYIDLSILARSFSPTQTLLQALAASTSSIAFFPNSRPVYLHSTSSSSSSSANSTHLAHLHQQQAAEVYLPSPDDEAAAAAAAVADPEYVDSSKSRHNEQQHQHQHQQQQRVDVKRAHSQALTSSSSSSTNSSDAPVVITNLARTYMEDLVDQVEAVSADIIALSEHTHRLGELVVNSVGHANEDANMTLAVIGTIFLPLTFIAGIYGMNYDNIPELHWEYGYLYFYMLTLGVVILAIIMMAWMRLIKIKPPKWVRKARLQSRLWWKSMCAKHKSKHHKHKLPRALNRSILAIYSSRRKHA